MEENSPNREPARDQRASEPPAEAPEGDGEPKPGESPGPLGNPEQDEEALRNEQQDN